MANSPPIQNSYFITLILFLLSFLLFSCQSIEVQEKDISETKDIMLFQSQENYLQMIYKGMDTLFVEFIKDERIDVNWTDLDGATFLHHAVWLEKKDLAEILIKSGADVKAKRFDDYTPLHWAAYKGNKEIAELLVNNGADINVLGSGSTPLYWAAARENNDVALYLINKGADGHLSGEDHPTPVDCFQEKMGIELDYLYETYNTSVIAALLENPEALETGKPELPPFPEASLSFSGLTNYLGQSVIAITVTNTGKGDLFGLTADINISGKSDRQRSVYFGKIAAGDTISRTCIFDDIDYSDIGKDLPVTVTFTESNEYIPENLNGKITVLKPDSVFIVDHIPELNTDTVKHMIDNVFFTRNDLSRAIILRAPDLGTERIKPYLESGLIDRTVIDKLIRYDKVPYTIEDLIYFAGKKAISQENLELVLLEKRVFFTSDDILRIAGMNYISRQVVEAFFSEGLYFSQNQIRQLADLNAFSLPEVLYTYTISDGDSASSSGNRDGMIQVPEGVDFDFIIKNNSVYNLSDVRISLNADVKGIDLFKNSTNINRLNSGETVSLNATIGVKRSFEGDVLPLQITIQDSQFGTIIDRELNVPVGRTVGSPVLTLSKKVSAVNNIVVKSGASSDSPQIAALSEGAVFDVIGELDNWYKVGIYGKYGWIEKSMVEDFIQPTSSTFLVENRKDFAVEGIGPDSESYAERAFVNSRPILEIISPSNNDNVYNRTNMEILAIDRTFGVGSVDIRVNGVQIEGSGARGLKVVDSSNQIIRKNYSLILQKGENEVSVTVYNTKNVASDTEVLHLYSQGVQNPPSLYILSVGVSEYEISSQNLTFAASDAEKIAAIFGSQVNADIYDKVHIKTLLNAEATRSSIKEGINSFLSDARIDDMVVLFFAGHGITDSRGRYYFLGHDGDMNNPSANGIKQIDFEDDLIASVQARKVLVLLDSCQSGGVTGRRGNDDITEVVDRLSKATGFTVISAARGNEYAYEDPDWDSGAFTLAVEEALGKSLADANKDGFIDLNELDSYVYYKVIELTGSKQHPTRKSYSAESYIFYQVP